MYTEKHDQHLGAVNAQIHQRTVAELGLECVFNYAGAEFIVARRVLTKAELSLSEGTKSGQKLADDLKRG